MSEQVQLRLVESGRQDLNLRPLDPQSSVLNQAELRPGAAIQLSLIRQDRRLRRVVNLLPGEVTARVGSEFVASVRALEGLKAKSRSRGGITGRTPVPPQMHGRGRWRDFCRPSGAARWPFVWTHG